MYSKITEAEKPGRAPGFVLGERKALRDVHGAVQRPVSQLGRRAACGEQ